MSEIKDAVLPVGTQGNDPNDFRDEAGYLESLTVTPAPVNQVESNNADGQDSTGVSSPKLDEGRHKNLIQPDNEDDLARLFSQKHQSILRYVAEQKRWYLWNGLVWANDRDLTVFDMLRTHCRDMLASDEKLRTKMLNARTIAATAQLVKSDRHHATVVEQWDANDWILNTPDGIIDLATGEVSPNDPSQHCTKITAIGPDGECVGEGELCVRVRRRVTTPTLAGHQHTGVSRAVVGKDRDREVLQAVLAAAVRPLPDAGGCHVLGRAQVQHVVGGSRGASPDGSARLQVAVVDAGSRTVSAAAPLALEARAGNVVGAGRGVVVRRDAGREAFDLAGVQRPAWAVVVLNANESAAAADEFRVDRTGAAGLDRLPRRQGHRRSEWLRTAEKLGGHHRAGIAETVVGLECDRGIEQPALAAAIAALQ